MTGTTGPEADRAQQPTPGAGRAALAFAAVALGIAAARALPHIPSLVWWSACSACAACAVMLRARGCATALLAGAAALGAAVFTARVIEPGDGVLAALVGPEGAPTVLTVEGLALETARPPLLDSPMARFAESAPIGVFTLRVERALTDRGWAACDGLLRCRVPGTTYSSDAGLGGFGVRAGRYVRLTGAAEQAWTLENPGVDDARLWYAQEGVVGSLRVASPELVVAMEEEARGVRARWCALRDALTHRAMRALDPGRDSPAPARALLLSLFLGQSEVGERELRGAFTRLGLAHVLAISGVHVVVMAGVGLFLLRLSGDRGGLEGLVVAALIVMYLVVVPASAPVVRAGVMSLVLLLGEAMGRRHDRVALLAWCGVGLLLWRPLDLWSLGFQLSMGCAVVLCWLGGRAEERIFGPVIRGLVPTRRTVWRAAWGSFRRASSASVLCWACSTPAIVARTGLVSPMAVATTLVTLPAITILMWAGFVTMVVGAAWPGAGEGLRPALGALSAACARMVLWLDATPVTAVRLPPVSAWWSAACTTSIVAWFAWGRRRDRRWWLAVAGLAAWFGAERAVAWRRENADLVRVDSVALGDGRCTLVRSGGGSALWNCGASRLDAGERIVAPALRALGAWRVRTVVVSEPDLKHISALPDIVEPLGVRRVLLCGAAARELGGDHASALAWLAGDLRSRGVEVRELAPGEGVAIGECTLGTLAPTAAGSGVVRAPNNEALALLAGDAPDVEHLLACPQLRAVRVIEAGPLRRVPPSDGVILWRTRDAGAEQERVLPVARRAGWGAVLRDGAVRSGR